MNKYLILLIVLVVFVAGGVGYRIINDTGGAKATGEIKEITIRLPKNTWSFEPEEVVVKKGDTVKLIFINEDEYDHGVGIDAYGVSQRIPARSRLEVPPFVATKAGTFTFLCSVSCGDSSMLPGGVVAEGTYAGKVRGHFDQTGTFKVIE